MLSLRKVMWLVDLVRLIIAVPSTQSYLNTSIMYACCLFPNQVMWSFSWAHTQTGSIAIELNVAASGRISLNSRTSILQQRLLKAATQKWTCTDQQNLDRYYATKKEDATYNDSVDECSSDEDVWHETQIPRNLDVDVSSLPTYVWL